MLHCNVMLPSGNIVTESPTVAAIETSGADDIHMVLVEMLESHKERSSFLTSVSDTYFLPLQ